MIEGVRSALRRSIVLSGGDTWWGHEGRLYDHESRADRAATPSGQRAAPR